MVKLEAKRDAENALLEEGRARLARLEAQAAARVVAPPPALTAVSDLEAEVSRLKAELAAPRAAVGSGLSGSRPQETVSPRRVSSELRRLNARVDGRSPQRFARGSGCWASFRSWQGLPLVDEGRTGVATVDSTTVVDAFCCSQFCEVMRQQVWRSFRTTLRWFQVILQYGLRGVRVGEALNLGPQTRRSTRLQGVRADHRRGLVVEVAPNVVDATAVDLSDDVSDDDDDVADGEAVATFQLHGFR